ncbi:TonB-dependent receptor [Candidatus Poribacteria bacterium]|nr:TonB-dependent receptor [Candidatus Poribacteria bacterium]
MNLHIYTYIIYILAILSISISAIANEETDDIYTLDQIVVTAQKRTQLPFNVPLSVSTIHGDKSNAIRASGLDLRFLSNRTPSLQIESSFGRIFPRLYIRGLGNTDFDLNASQPVSVLHDGIVLENPLLKGFPAFDLERIEVLRGPQGTLFGRNTPAGAIKLESVRPKQKIEGFSNMNYGTLRTYNHESAVSIPIIPNILSTRFSTLIQRRSDWVNNQYTNQENALGGHADTAARIQLLWTPTPELETLFKIHARDLDGTARLFRANILKQNVGGLIDDFERANISQDAQNQQTLNSKGMAFQISYDIGNYQIISLTGIEQLTTFSRGDIDGGYGAAFLTEQPSGPGNIPFPSETAAGIPNLRQYSQELRFMSPENSHITYLFGLYYFHEFVEMEDFNYDTLAGGTLDGVVRQEQTAIGNAAFAAMTYKLADPLEVATGIRLSNDAKEYTAWRDQAPAVTDAGTLGPIHKNPQDTVWSGDLSLRYEFNSHIQTYIRAARGFRAPSIQGRLLFGNEVTVADTETIHSVELGTKTRLWDQRLNLNLTAFNYIMHDQQLTAVGGEANFNRLVNVENTIGRGIEVELTFNPIYVFGLTAGLSYNHTQINDPNLAIQGCGAPCTVLNPVGTVENTYSIDGNTLPQAPTWIADIEASYLIELPAGYRIIASTDWAYRSRVHFFLYDSVEFSDDSLLEGGIRIACQFPNTDSGIAIIGRNILNETSPTGGIDFNNLTGFINEPSFWGIELISRY